MGKNFPPWRFTELTDGLGINSHNNTLRTKALGGLAYKIGIKHCRRVNTHLIGTRIKHAANIFAGTNAATYSKGYKHLASHAFYRVHHGVTVFVGSADIQKGDFIGTLFVIALGYFYRVTRIADINKLHAFNNAAVFYIQTRDNTFCQSHYKLPSHCTKFFSSCKPAVWLFSGWNCTANKLGCAKATSNSTPY